MKWPVRILIASVLLALAGCNAFVDEESIGPDPDPSNVFPGNNVNPNGSTNNSGGTNVSTNNVIANNILPPNNLLANSCPATTLRCDTCLDANQEVTCENVDGCDIPTVTICDFGCEDGRCVEPPACPQECTPEPPMCLEDTFEICFVNPDDMSCTVLVPYDCPAGYCLNSGSMPSMPRCEVIGSPCVQAEDDFCMNPKTPVTCANGTWQTRPECMDGDICDPFLAECVPLGRLFQ